MKKGIIISIVLLSCCAAQGIQNKTSDLKMYKKKAHQATQGSWYDSLYDTSYYQGYPSQSRSAEGQRRDAWYDELRGLKRILSEKTLYLGVPENKQATTPTISSRFLNYVFGNYSNMAKQYSLLTGFADTEDAYKLNHYELYCMPDDSQLYKVCVTIKNNIKEFFALYGENPNRYVAFIAVRPTPGVTRSPFDSKFMPRIIVGLKSAVNTELTADYKYMVENLIYYLSKTTEGNGCLGKPRYSKQFKDSCIFWRYGSPDNRAGLRLNTFGIDQDTELFKPNAKHTDKYPYWEQSQKVENALKNAYRYPRR